MAQLVFEFWSQEIEPVVEAIARILDGCPTDNNAASSSLELFEPTPKGLDGAAQQMRLGRFSYFTLHPRTGSIRYAMLVGPDPGGTKRPGYMGTIEYTRLDYIHIWDRLLDMDGLQILCLGHEEGVEFNVDQLVAETFPWDDFYLMIAAVRSHVGDRIVKHGPRYFPSGG
jgi:hypothetical protein